MDKFDTLLVIARKYNDIFYAISTPEWKCYNRHILVIFANDNFVKQFPAQERFDDIVIFNSVGNRIGDMGLIRKIQKEKLRIQCDAIMLSNIVIVINQYLIKVCKGRQIYLLEDGLMNYYDFHPSTSKIKRLSQLLLGINERKLFNQISKTFLLNPNLAQYYGGRLEQLQLSSYILNDNIQLDIKGKKIFVGQCLYRFGYMSLRTYNDHVNRIIKKYDIDYYLPHAFAMDGERINCSVLNIQEKQTTLEALAFQTNFVIYSFCSSVLYTTRIINPDIQTFLIRIPELYEKSELPVIKKYCTGVVDF